jgi:hypothetical protein
MRRRPRANFAIGRSAPPAIQKKRRLLNVRRMAACGLLGEQPALEEGNVVSSVFAVALCLASSGRGRYSRCGQQPELRYRMRSRRRRPRCLLARGGEREVQCPGQRSSSLRVRPRTHHRVAATTRDGGARSIELKCSALLMPRGAVTMRYVAQLIRRTNVTA